MLLCTFASPRSSPATLDLWIRYLEAQGERHRDDPEAVALIARLMARAQAWRLAAVKEYRPTPPLAGARAEPGSA